MRIVMSVNTHYGYRYIVAEMIGTAMEWMCYGILNIWTANGEGWTIAGFLVSVAFIGGLSWVFYGCLKTAIKLKEYLSNPRIESKDKSFKFLSKSDSTYDFLFGVVFESYRVNMKKLGLLLPLIELLKTLLFSLLLFMPYSYPQLIVMLLIELSSFTFILHFRVKASLTDNILDLLNSAGISMYVLLDMVVLSVSSEYIRQHVLGYGMMIILIGILGINIGYGIVIAVGAYIVKPVVKYIRMIKPSKNRVLTSTPIIEMSSSTNFPNISTPKNANSTLGDSSTRHNLAKSHEGTNTIGNIANSNLQLHRRRRTRSGSQLKTLIVPNKR